MKNSYIFVAPTSLEKNNTRLQILFNIGLHYNFFKLLLVKIYIYLNLKI